MREMKELTSESEAVQELRDRMRDVVGKRWMVALWCVDDTEKEGEPNLLRFVGKITWKFPVGDFKRSLQLLANYLEEQTKLTVPPEPPPLKLASFDDLLAEMDPDATPEFIETEGKEEEVEEDDVPVYEPMSIDELIKKRTEKN